MSNQNAVTLQQKLESLIVEKLQEKLKTGVITGDRAKEIAKIVLKMVPEDIAEEELVKIIPQLDDKISELAGVVYEILSDRDEQEKNRKLDHLRNMIRSMQNV